MVITFSAAARGQTGNSMNLLALGICAAYRYHKRVLILDTFFSGNSLESMLVRTERGNRRVLPEEFGIDALIRMKSYGGIHAETIHDTSYSFLNGALSFLPGTRQASREVFLHSVGSQYETILEEACAEWDLVLIDLDPGIREVIFPLQRMVDWSIISLCQNPQVLSRYFASPDGVQGGRKLYLIGNYDPKSRYNLTNLRHLYPVLAKKNTEVVPYHTGWRDAAYEAMTVRYLMRSMEEADRRGHTEFVQSLDRMTARILSLGR